MTKRTELEILKLVSTGYYEAALDISVDAAAPVIARAHIRQLHRFSCSVPAREALNRARTALLDETVERRVQRLVNTGQLEDARTVMAKSMGSKPTAYENYMMGYILYHMDRYVEAERCMRQAYEASASPLHSVWLGRSLERQGRSEEALECYLFAIEHRGSEMEHRLAGNLCFHTGQFDKACALLEKSIALGCRDEDVFEKVAAIHQKQKYSRLVSRVRSLFSSRKAD